MEKDILNILLLIEGSLRDVSHACTVHKKIWIEGCISKDKGLKRRGIIAYIEFQSVCPFVGIGSPTPPSPQACVSSPHLDPGGIHTR